MKIDKIMAELVSVGYYPTKNMLIQLMLAFLVISHCLLKLFFMLDLSLYKKIAQNHNSGLEKDRVVVF